MHTYILGANASLSARSPKIFKFLSGELNIPLAMKPIDIQNKTSFINQLKELSEINDFHGLLITNPWKDLWSSINRNHPSIRVKSSKIANLFWKDKDGRNRFENTDLIALRIILKKLKPKNVIIIGTGAMNKTISLVLNIKKNNIKLHSITSKKINSIDNKSIIFNEDTERIIKLFSQANLIINATPCGSKGFPGIAIDKTLLDYARKDCTVFDLVHTHNNLIIKEVCQKNSIHYIDGISMNNIQAVLAFKIMFSKYTSNSCSQLYSLLDGQIIK